MLLTTRSKEVMELLENREKLIAESFAADSRKVRPHNPLDDVLADGAWAGQPCFIIAGGPSLTGFDFERLRGRGKIIAINRALEFVPFADIAFFMDWKLYRTYHDDPAKKALWDRFEGIKIFLNLMGRAVDDVRSVRARGKVGIADSLAGGLYHGSNSGFGAFNLALVLKASPIYLLGYDMRQRQDKTHFHDGYGQRPHGSICAAFLRPFKALESQLGAMKHIINLSPDSALTMFRKGDIEEVLGGHDRQGLGHDVMPVP